MDRIAGRTVVVTGGARGIGHAIAGALLARRARIVIGDRDVGQLATAVADLSRIGPVTGHPLDVSDPASFAGFLDKARSDGAGRIDVLINNAGVMPIGHFLDQSDRAIRAAIGVNLYGPITGCRMVLPEMAARRSGHIVNIASMAGMVPVPGQIVYAATKFAVVGLSIAMADEFADRGVAVTAVLPTFTRTELITGTHPTAAQRTIAPEDVAAAVVKLLDKPKIVVSVPPSLKLLSAATQALPAPARRWINRKMGNDRVFLDVDPALRQSYERRTGTAQGIAESEPD
jgi:NAD(P)-dependent dehydrogenase (short-subunit alcohol dehydrogenase family)